MRLILISLICLALVGCDLKKNIEPSQTNIITEEIDNGSSDSTELPILQDIPVSDGRIEGNGNFDDYLADTSVEYFIFTESSNEEIVSPAFNGVDEKTLKEQIVNAYCNKEPLFFANNAQLVSVSFIKVYSLPIRDDYLIITVDKMAGWPCCMLFSYKDNFLSSINLISSGLEVDYERSEEIRLHYGKGFPFPIF